MSLSSRRRDHSICPRAHRFWCIWTAWGAAGLGKAATEVTLWPPSQSIYQARIIVDIFPYGPTGVPLEQRRVTGVVWCIAKHVFPPLIWLRNLAQLPLLHLPVLGTAVRTQLALEVASRLTAVGHTPGRPVVLVGFSAGAHVAECIAGILVELCGGRVHRVHIAGVDRRPTAAPGCSIRVDSRADRICALVRVGLQRDITCGVEVMGVHHFGPEGWTSITPRASDGSVPVELAAAAVSSVVGQLVGEGSDGACANFTKSRDCSALAE